MTEETNPTKSIYEIILMTLEDSAEYVLDNPEKCLKNLTQKEIANLDTDDLYELPIKHFKQSFYKDCRIILDLIAKGWELKQPEDREISELKQPEDQEISELKKMLGLHEGVDYTNNVNKLRYSSIMKGE